MTPQARTTPLDTPRVPDDTFATTHVTGQLVQSWLWDVGDAIDLRGIAKHVRQHAIQRRRPNIEAALTLAEAPVTISLGTDAVLGADVQARCYHFGVVALQWIWQTPQGLLAKDYLDWSQAQLARFRTSGGGEGTLAPLLEQLHPLIRDPRQSPITEDYLFHRIQRVLLPGETSDVAAPVLPAEWPVSWLAALLSGEPRLGRLAQRDLVPEPLGYHEEDHAWIGWDAAILADPQMGESDVAFLLEFANAQLLQLRVYDALLTEERARIAEDQQDLLPGGWRAWRHRRRAELSVRAQQQRVAEITDLVERAEHAIKITEDAWLGRVYEAAFHALRGPAWREHVDRQLAIVQQWWTTVLDGASARRSEQLEIMIVLLIVAEIVISLVRSH